MNNGIIAIIFFGCIITVGLIVAVIIFRIKKSRQTIIDPSDAFELEIDGDKTHIDLYN